MALFSYKGRDKTGKAKRGKVNAEDKRDAIVQLRRQGTTVFEIKELNSVLYKEIHLGSKKVKHKDFIIFLRQYATLVEAGISLTDATSILKEQTENKQLEQALAAVKDGLESGQTLSKSMESYKTIFPELLVNMIHAGEVSGNLDEILNNMANYYEKQYQQRQKVKAALTYPITVGLLTFFIVIFLLTFIVPTFANMFISMGEEVPVYTAFILQVSGFLKYFWWLIPLIIVLFIILFKSLVKKENYAYKIDLIKMKLPLFGNLIRKAALARMTRTMSSLLHSSVAIVEAVAITEKVMDNKVVESVLKQSQESLEEGESMSIPMANHWVFPALVTEMIAVGEQTGALDDMLKKVADFYEQELDHAAEQLKALIEPVMVISLAVIVGAIVLAIVIPMFAIFDSI